MYFGQVDPGSRFRIIAQKGRRAQCPAGTSQESSGRLGTGQEYAWCYRGPTFAPPATTRIYYEAPRTTVSPAIQAQISPQVSPILTQAQASPGMAVQAAPAQVMPGGMRAAGGAPGITAADLSRILAEQRRADEQRRASEFQAMQRDQQRRADILEEQRRRDAQERADREAARQAAEGEAMERAIALPPPPTAGAFVPPSPMQPPIFEPPPGPITEIDITEEPLEAGFPVPWLLLAAAGVGTALLLGRKKGARKQ